MKAPKCGWREAWTRIEDRWYQVPSDRRRELISQVRVKVTAHLEPGHERIRDFDAITARTVRPSSLIHMARVHGVRGAWRWRDWWRSLRRSDAATVAHMAATWIALHRVPGHAWWMVLISLSLTWAQRCEARQRPVTVYCPQTVALAVAHECQTPIAVNTPTAGWRRVDWWRVRVSALTRAPAVNVDLAPFVLAALLLCVWLVPDPVHPGVIIAALGATGAFEVRTGGNAANSGYFNAGGGSPGTDRSQQTTPHVTIDGVTITATVHTTTSQLNIVGHTVSAADNRNGVRIAGGTMTAGLYEITAVDAVNNRWTLDRAGGTAGQTGTGRMGGAIPSLGLAGGSVPTSRNKIWIDDGTYTISSATDNIDGGTFDPTVALYIEGYQTTRGDLGTPPLLQASGISTFIMLELDSAGANVNNLSLDAASLTSGRGFEFASFGGFGYKLSAINCTNNAYNIHSANLVSCVASGHATQPAFGVQIGSMTHCVAHGGTTTGFSMPVPSSIASIAFSLSYNNSGASSDGFEVSSIAKIVMHCVAYGNGRDGFRSAGTGPVTYISNIAESNTGIGFNFPTGASDKVLLHNAAYGNGTDQVVQGDTFILGATIIGAGSFFTNAAAGDFTLNTSGAGADLLAAGFNSFPLGLTASYADIGAAQSGEGGPGAGGTPVQLGSAHVGM